MRKKFSAGAILPLLLAALLLFPTSALAVRSEDDYSDGDLYYRIENGSIVITGYFGRDEECRVPNAIGEYPVNVIDSGAFLGTTLKRIYLPDTIMKVEDGAFNENQEIIRNYNIAAIDPANPDPTDPSAVQYEHIKSTDGFLAKIEAGSAVIISYDADKLPESGELTVPSKISGVTVTKIEDDVFSGKGIKVLRIPACVKTVGSISDVPKVILNYDSETPHEVEQSTEAGQAEEIVIDAGEFFGTTEAPTYQMTLENGLIVAVSPDGARVIGYDRKYFPKDGIITVPEEVDGKKVVAIDEDALRDSGITKLIVDGKDVDLGNASENVPEIEAEYSGGDSITDEEPAEPGDRKGSLPWWAWVLIGVGAAAAGVGTCVAVKKKK